MSFLFEVVERYLFHKNYVTGNPIAKEIAEKMCDIELSEMWMLTQINERSRNGMILKSF